MPLLSDSLRNLAHALIVAAVVIAGLVLGRDILIPLVLAVMIAFVLSPIVRMLTLWSVPRAIAVLLTVTVVTGALAGVSGVLSSEVLSLTADLGKYRENVMVKVRALTGAGGGSGSIGKATAAIEQLGAELDKELNGRAPPGTAGAPTSPQTGTSTTPAQPAPLPQQGSNQPPPAASEPAPGKATGFDMLSALGGPATKFALTFLFAIFLMLQYQDLRDRVVRVVGTDHMSDTTSAMSEAGERLSKLFMMQAILNSGFGVFIGLALWMIGVPNALLWGVVAAMMRFVPYIGSFLAAVPPIVLAAAVDPGWSMFLATLAVFVVGEPLMGHGIEPLVLGKKAGISPFAMVTSASFWTLLWGPIGLILAAPLTMVLIVLGKYIDGLHVFSVLLGDEPALTRDQEFYHRLLSDDPISAIESFETAADETSISKAIDDLVLPALSLAAFDHRFGRLDTQQIANIGETVQSLRESLDVETNVERDQAAGQRVVVIAARGAVDAAAAHFVTNALAATIGHDVTVIAESSGLTALASAKSIASDEPLSALVVVTVGGADASQLRFIATRAERDFPDARIIAVDAEKRAIPRLERPQSDATTEFLRVRHFDDVLQQLKTITAKAPGEHAEPPGRPVPVAAQ